MTSPVCSCLREQRGAITRRTKGKNMNESAAVTPKTTPSETGIPLLGKCHDITAFASTDPGRWPINGVHYHAEKHAIEATDGRVLIRVPVPVSDDFPPLGENRHAAPDCIIPPAPFKKALANVPRKATLPVLQNVALNANGKPGRVILTTNDLDTQTDLDTKPLDANFPNCDQAIPEEKPTFSITIAGNILARIADYAIKHGRHAGKYSDGVRFDFTKSTEPVLCRIPTEAGEALIVAMPMRLS